MSVNRNKVTADKVVTADDCIEAPVLLQRGKKNYYLVRVTD